MLLLLPHGARVRRRCADAGARGGSPGVTRLRALPVLLLETLVLVIGPACTIPTRPPGGLAEQQNLSMVGAALRIRVRGLIGPFVGAVEQAADAAARRCGEDPAAAAGALSWKLGAVPQVQDALLQPDPAVAFADGWAYAVQMQLFLAGEGGRAALGACHADASATMGRVAMRSREIADVLAPENAARAEARVRAWAAEHPLRGLELPRPSFAAELAAGAARDDLGALGAVGVAVQSLDDLTYRIAAYRETILKEARWAGELAATQAGGSAAARRALSDLDRFGAAADRLAALAAGLPALMARERTAALDGLRGERAAVLGDVDRQRNETLRFLQNERAAIMGDVQALGQATVDQATDRVERVVDRAFLRAAQLSVALLLVISIAAGVVAWVIVHAAAGWRLRHPRTA